MYELSRRKGAHDAKVIRKVANLFFRVIWKISNAFPDNASELSTFLIHRQSKDKLSGLIELFSRDVF